jgi:hypothetical protein
MLAGGGGRGGALLCEWKLLKRLSFLCLFRGIMSVSGYCEVQYNEE